MEQFFTQGYRYDGPRFRGPSVTEQANQLVYFGQYYLATGDPTGIFERHLPAIMHYIQEYRALRARSLMLPKVSAAYGSAFPL
jgi:hypothetical protein